MSFERITPPAALEVTLADAKTQLGIDGTELDGIVTAWIKGIVAYAEHQTGRCILDQTWRVTLDSFPDAIRLPSAPVSAVVSLKFIDIAGVEQTLNPLDYELTSESQAAWIVPAPGKAWPATYARINAVKADVICGYGATASSVPDEFRLFIFAKLREQFDAATRPERDTVQASFIDHLLDSKKVYG